MNKIYPKITASYQMNPLKSFGPNKKDIKINSFSPAFGRTESCAQVTALIGGKILKTTLPSNIETTNAEKWANFTTFFVGLKDFGVDIDKLRKFIEALGSLKDKIDPMKMLVFVVKNGLDFTKMSEFLAKSGYQKACAIEPRVAKMRDLQLLNFIRYHSSQDEKLSKETLVYKRLDTLFERKLISNSELKRILTVFPSTNRDVGQVPKPWLERIPKEEQEKAAKAIRETLAAFAKKIDSHKDVDVDKLFFKEMEELDRTLSKITERPVAIDYIDSGTIGKAFYIRVSSNKYVLKTFHDTNELGNLHGKSTEIQVGAYAKKHAKKNQFAQFYFGKVAGEDDTDGFMVIEYIGKTNPKNNKHNYPLNYEQFMRTVDDNDENYHNGRLIDYGGITLEPKLANGKIRKHMRVLSNLFRTKDKNTFYAYLEKHQNEPEFKEMLEKVLPKGYLELLERRVNEPKTPKPRVKKAKHQSIPSVILNFVSSFFRRNGTIT